MLHLQQAGHPHYVEWSRSFACNSVKEKELQDMNEKMKKEFQKWQIIVSNLRANLYAMNFFTCLQLLRISNEFHCLIYNPNHEVNKEILLLLMSLSSNLTVDNIKAVTSTAEAQSIALRSLPSFTSPDHDESHCVMDIVDVPREISKLNEAEKKQYFSVVEDYEFKPQMVLAAIRQCGPADDDEVANWCLENIGLFENKPVVSKVSDKPTVSEVDLTNPDVKELVEMQFSESLAIEAVKMHGDDETKCYDYCLDATLANSGMFSDDTQNEMTENISLDAYVPYEIENTDAGVLEYVIIYVYPYCIAMYMHKNI